MMFKVEQCLAKAVELEQRMGEGLPPESVTTIANLPCNGGVWLSGP
jgi:hypothetical protein